MSATKNILVVDDQPSLLYGLQLTLESAGFRALTAADGQMALHILNSNHVDLVLADIAMPNINGYQLHEQIRANPDWVHIPFLLLTARALDSDIRFGKEMGVDDYLTKPCEPEDLLASIRGCLRRAEQWRQATSMTSPRPPNVAESLPANDLTIQIGDIVIFPGEYKILVKGKAVKLSAREFDLLEHFAKHKNHLLSPTELVKVTHNLTVDFSEASNLIRPYVRTLRRKLGFPVGESGTIETVRGVGYRLLAS
jgi:DNA-binding response OmpR family regulator